MRHKPSCSARILFSNLFSRPARQLHSALYDARANATVERMDHNPCLTVDARKAAIEQTIDVPLARVFER